MRECTVNLIITRNKMPLSVDNYRQILDNQSGDGYRFDPFQLPNQHGEGIGSFFGKLLRNHVIPLVPALLRRAAGAAINVANDMSTDPNARVSTAVKRHGIDALRGLAGETFSHLQKGRGKRPSGQKKKKTTKRLNYY